jgi:hypothetical protein
MNQATPHQAARAVTQQAETIAAEQEAGMLRVEVRRAVPTVVGRVTGVGHQGNQCRGMPRAICHACGLGYRCSNPDCEQTGREWGVTR